MLVLPLLCLLTLAAFLVLAIMFGHMRSLVRTQVKTAVLKKSQTPNYTSVKKEKGGSKNEMPRKEKGLFSGNVHLCWVYVSFKFL